MNILLALTCLLWSADLGAAQGEVPVFPQAWQEFPNLKNVFFTTGDDPLLILSGNVGRLLSVPHGLTLVNLRSNRVKFVPTVKAVTGIAYDANRKLVYFTDGDGIFRLHLDKLNQLFGIVAKTAVEEVVKSGGKVLQYSKGKWKKPPLHNLVSLVLGKITSIALDWIAGNIYYASKSLAHIGACSVNGSYCARVVQGLACALMSEPIQGYFMAVLNVAHCTALR